MTYTINTNTTFNSLEITFDSKPNEKVLEALKALHFRWHRQKALWYGFATDTEVIKAIQNAEQEANPIATGVIYSDGYMGAVKTDGVNSNKYLYGKSLSAAIREHLKQAGIKGVTASCKTYMGGQSLTLKIKFTPADIIPLEDFLAQYAVNPYNWYYYDDGGQYPASMHGEQYWTLDDEKRDEMRRKFAEHDYRRILAGSTLNQYHLTTDKYPEFTPDFFKKITEIDKIVRSYNYDDSNAMVDYFDTNFYYNLETVPATK